MAAREKKILTLQVDDKEQMDWICAQHEKGDMIDVPVGPIASLVPSKYHVHIPRGILKSLLCETEESASIMRRKIGVADIPVITKTYSESVYEHIMKNLTDIGKDLIEDVHPWIINTLVDWANIDKLICTSPLEEKEKQSFEEHSLDKNNNGSDDSKGYEEETSIRKTTVESQYSSKVWKSSEVKTLIDLHMKKEYRFNKPGSKKKAIWQEISDEINKLGNTFTYSQCEQKWKNLTKTFRDTIDHNSKSGNEPKECPFFKEMEEAYGYKANVKPVFILGSMTSKETVVNEDMNSDDESLNDTMASVSDDPSNKGNKISDSSSSSETSSKKRKTNALQNELLQSLQNFHKECKEEQQEFLSELKHQHDEKMKKEDKKLELMSELIQLLKK